MERFLESKKQRMVTFKSESPYISDEAREDGEYKGKQRPFCLARGFSREKNC